MTRFATHVVLLVIVAAITFSDDLAAQEGGKSATPADGFPLPAGAVHRFGNRQARHADGITGSAISPDGKHLATIGSGSIVVWDTKTLNAKCVIRGQPVPNTAGDSVASRLSFLPDSKSLVVGVRSVGPRRTGTTIECARVFDIETGKVKFELKGDQDYWTGVWVTAGGKEIALYTLRAVRYFDARDGKELRKELIPMSTYQGMPTVAAAANLVALRDRDNSSLRICDAKITNKEVYNVGATNLLQFAMSPDGKLLVCHENTGKVHIHDVEAKKELFAFDHPAAKQIGPMRFSADKQILYFGGQHGQLYRWDLKNNRRLPDVGRHSTWTLTSIALSPDEQILYSMGNDKLVRRWDVKTAKELPLPEGYTTQTAVVPTTDGKHLIVVDHAGHIDYWNLTTGKHIKQLQKGRAGGLDCVAVSADGRWLAGGRTLQDMQLWDLAAGKLERIIPLVEEPDTKGGDHVKRVAFSPDAKVVLSGSPKTGVTAWEVPSGKKVWNSPQAGHLLAYDPTGRWIVSGTGITDPPIVLTILDPKTGDTVRRLEAAPEESQDQRAYGYPPYLTDLVFTPDGSRILSAHYDGSIRVWDPDAGKEVSRIRTGYLGMSGMSISADGRLVALGRADRKIVIWELVSGKEVMSIDGHDSVVRDVAFTRDGRGIIGNADLAPVLWSLAPKDLPTVDGSAEDLWANLASDDGGKAYRLQWSLARNPKTAVTLFRERIKPEELTSDRGRFDKLVSNLDSQQFRTREAAERELMQAGLKVPRAWLQQALANAKSDEMRARLGRVMAQREKPDPNEWRLARAIHTLELAGTDEARTLLKSWAAVEGSTLSLDAKAALERLAAR